MVQNFDCSAWKKTAPNLGDIWNRLQNGVIYELLIEKFFLPQMDGVGIVAELLEPEMWSGRSPTSQVRYYFPF